MHETTRMFEVGDKKDYVCKLNISLYGLKQPPKKWNKQFHEFITNIGFETCVHTLLASHYKFSDE